MPFSLFKAKTRKIVVHCPFCGKEQQGWETTTFCCAGSDSRPHPEIYSVDLGASWLTASQQMAMLLKAKGLEVTDIGNMYHIEVK